jgi:cell division protein FtsW (lipid II flippase)
MNVLHRTDDRHLPGFSLGRYLRHFDWVLLVATLGIVGMGMAMIYSATHADTNISSSTYYLRSQAEGLVLGLILLVLISLVDYSWFAQWQRVIYGIMVFLLAITLVVGAQRMGARRWIVLPFFDLQTSELAKLLLIVSFGSFLARFGTASATWSSRSVSWRSPPCSSSWSPTWARPWSLPSSCWRCSWCGASAGAIWPCCSWPVGRRW